MPRTAVAPPSKSRTARGAAPTDELAAALRLCIGRLARRLRRHAVGGLTATEYSVLASVDVAGPIRPSDLARREGIGPPTLSRVMTRLESDGYLAREPDPDDGRCSLMAVGAAGRRLLDEVRGERTALLSDSLLRLEPEARRRILAAVPDLERLIALMREAPETGPRGRAR